MNRDEIIKALEEALRLSLLPTNDEGEISSILEETIPLIRSLIAELAELREKAEVAKQIYNFAMDILYADEPVGPNSWYKNTDKVYGRILRELHTKLIEQKERTK